jgi:uncharacterized membrane protein YdjX (TVP38/TMEM64 family)
VSIGADGSVIETFDHSHPAFAAAQRRLGIGEAEIAESLKKSPGRGGLVRYAPMAIIVAGLASAYALGLHRYLTLEWLGDSRDALRARVATDLPGSILLFLLIQVTAVAFAAPFGAIFAVFAGFLFGWKLGMAVVWSGAVVGATILFLAARSAFGGVLKARAGGFAGRFAEGFEADAFSYLLVLRIAPFIPFFVVNILPAFFNVRLRTFLVATMIGILPGAFAYSRLGEGIDSMLAVARAAGREVTLADVVTREISLAFAALALVTLFAAVVRRRWMSRAAALQAGRR